MVQQLIHGAMLLFILFAIAETGKVLIHDGPQYQTPITIWQEGPQVQQTKLNLSF